MDEILNLIESVSEGFLSYSIIQTFNYTSTYIGDILNIDIPYFEGIVGRIYSPELQLTKTNASDTESPFLDLLLSISNGFVSSKFNYKRNDFNPDKVNFPILVRNVLCFTSYGLYIAQLIGFYKVSSHVTDFNARIKILTAKPLRQGYRYQKLRKKILKIYRRHYELVPKFKVGLKSILQQANRTQNFMVTWSINFKTKNVSRADFSDQFRKVIMRYNRIEYNINVMRQCACLDVNPVTVNTLPFSLSACRLSVTQTQ